LYEERATDDARAGVMRRRSFLTGVAAVSTPTVALAQTRTVPLAKALPFLEAYESLTPAEHSRFSLAYMFLRDKKPAPGLKATIIGANGARTPLALDRTGVVMRLPSPAELKSASLEIEGGPVGLALQVRLVAPPALQFDATLIEAALAQANQAEGKIAGAFALLAPKLTCALFPGAGPAHAAMADGRLSPLPVTQNLLFGQIPYFEPAALAGARAVQLARPPPFVLLGSHPKA
jgi:hypothetical protein